jgi:NADH dehydrogenase
MRRTIIRLERIVPPRVRVLKGEIEDVSPGSLEVRTDKETIKADWLVVCLGTAASDLGVPGAGDHVLPLKSAQDCLRLRKRLQEVRASGRDSRVVVVGGGYTGTEIAGELSDPGYLKAGPPLDVTIVQPDNRLLPHGNPELAAAVHGILERRGVGIRCGVWLSKIDGQSVQLETGESLPADLVVWTASTRPARVVKAALGASSEGRVAVDPYLRAFGNERVYVAGDLAGALDTGGNLLPASAQVAVRQGVQIGQNISRALSGKQLQEFRPRVLGDALTLGRQDAAAEVAGVLSTGLVAQGLKRAALFRYLSGFGSLALLRDYL